MFHNFLFVFTLISVGKTQPAIFPQIQQWNTKKSCEFFSKLTLKTPKECQCFLMPSCQWGLSGGYSSTWICFNIYLSIIYFICYTARYMMRQTRVPPNITRSTKLWETKRSPELAFRNTNFCVPENLIFPALWLLLQADIFLQWLNHDHIEYVIIYVTLVLLEDW